MAAELSTSLCEQLPHLRERGGEIPYRQPQFGPRPISGLVGCCSGSVTDGDGFDAKRKDCTSRSVYAKPSRHRSCKQQGAFDHKNEVPGIYSRLGFELTLNPVWPADAARTELANGRFPERDQNVGKQC